MTRKRKNIKSCLKKNLYKILTLILTVLIAGITFWLNHISNSYSELQSEYAELQAEYTELQIHEEFLKNSVEHLAQFQYKAIQIADFEVFPDSSKESLIRYLETGELLIDVFPTINFIYTNIGNSNARNQRWISGVKMTNEFILRDSYNDVDSNKSNFNKPKELLRQDVVAPLDNSATTIRQGIADVDANNRFLLHFVMFYENDMGHLFDTYYMNLIEMSKINFRIILNPDTSIRSFFLIDPIEFKIIRTMDDFKVYPMNESEDMKKKIDEYYKSKLGQESNN